MNSDKFDDANEKSRAIDIAREDGRLQRVVSKRVDEGFGCEGNEREKVDGRVQRRT